MVDESFNRIKLSDKIPKKVASNGKAKEEQENDGKR